MKIVKYAAIGFVALMVIGLFGSDDKPAEVAQETPQHSAPPAPARPAPTPPAAAQEPERPVVDGPDKYGDDPELDALWDLCDDADYEACEDLYWTSPLGSQYESDALSMLNIIDEGLDARGLVDLIGADVIMDMVWNQRDEQGQAEICDGYRLLGGIGAGTILSESSSGTVTADEAADWLRRRCQ